MSTNSPEYQREWRKKHPGKSTEYNRRWRTKNRKHWNKLYRDRARKARAALKMVEGNFSTSINTSSLTFPDCRECKVRFGGCTTVCASPTCNKKAVQKFDNEPETANVD